MYRLPVRRAAAIVACICLMSSSAKVLQAKSVEKSDGAAKLSVDGDLSTSGNHIQAKVKVAIKLHFAGIHKSIDVGQYTITESMDVRKKVFYFGSGPGRLKATVRVYPLKKVAQHWESKFTLTVRIGGTRVAHLEITLKY